MNRTRRVAAKSTHKFSKVFVSWNSCSTSALKRGSTELFLLISLIIAPTIFAASPVNAASTITAEVNGQLNICHPPDPCFMAKLQANASGPDGQDLTGMLLISSAALSPPQPCTSAVTGNAAVQTAAPTATLTGTLGPAEPAAAACAGGLQGISVTLTVDSMSGTIRLTTVSSAGSTESLGVGTGTLIITQG